MRHDWGLRVFFFLVDTMNDYGACGKRSPAAACNIELEIP